MARKSRKSLPEDGAANDNSNGNGDGVGERLRAYFLAGILVTGPIAFTLWITWSIVDFIDRAVSHLVPTSYNPGTYFPFNIPGFGLVVAVVALTLIGWLTAGYAGRLLLRLSDRIMKRMPVVRGIYGAFKQIFETVLAKRSNTFREVVLVEWPRRGMWTVAFVTAQGEGEIKAKVALDTVGLYVPTTPNPTSGYLVYVPREDIVPLSMSVEDGIKLVISGGIITPESLEAPPTAKVEEIVAPK
ncbi:MAG: DUF502 domain-containing protein [Alphaproteobacteria bacterium]|nr:DUF502 domain-containing protein [Alphaproteobacteria bacterium]MDE1968754.1 DUF502 domain-containing protein [Alphaproteobacteria bacterium]MDE2513405.1 DUF502 domain-containing protein [Alphaproteobacteria bacterium]